ncbi:hypothetical protein GGQ92_002063 [Gracilibacillus halotolerans]|uniref:Uncharacterized protein n=1 Tax=Gracilibacillus halotolerans TaxID=74386 RepID=A0A841RLA1_9BACI|nr:hypothetical protein [Gracilibacillus halotolerans]MBB6513259.1 hypothetical protein [Gracilibacillus halotolerans]
MKFRKYILLLFFAVILLFLFINFSDLIGFKKEEFVIRELKDTNQTLEDSRVFTDKEKIIEIKIMLENLTFDGIYDMAGTPNYEFYFKEDEQTMYQGWEHHSPRMTIVNSISGGTTIDITDPLYQLITEEEISEFALTELALADYISNKISSAFEEVKASPTEKNYLQLYYTLQNIDNKVQKEMEKYQSVVDKDIWISYTKLPENNTIEYIKQLAENTEKNNPDERFNLEKIEKIWIQFEKDIRLLMEEDTFTPTLLAEKYIALILDLNDIDSSNTHRY